MTSNRSSHSLPRHYILSDLPALTGLSTRNVLMLEHLGILPSSACHHVVGRFWLADEVEDWLLFLERPGVRLWLESLLAAPPEQSTSELLGAR